MYCLNFTEAKGVTCVCGDRNCSVKCMSRNVSITSKRRLACRTTTHCITRAYDVFGLDELPANERSGITRRYTKKITKLPYKGVLTITKENDIFEPRI